MAAVELGRNLLTDSGDNGNTLVHKHASLFGGKASISNLHVARMWFTWPIRGTMVNFLVEERTVSLKG